MNARFSKILHLLFLPAVVCLLSSAEKPQEFDLVSDDDGIRVFRLRDDSASTVTLKAETVFDASPEVVFRVITDNNIAARWVPLAVKRYTLKQLSDKERVEYTHLDLPMPATDRYFITRGKAEFLSGEVRLSVKSVENPEEYMPKDPDKVLGEVVTSEFILRPVENGRKTFVSLLVNSDPKGLIPKWLANRFQMRWPRQFFTGLREQVNEQVATAEASAAASIKGHH